MGKRKSHLVLRKEQAAREYLAVCRSMHLKQLIQKYGLKQVMYAMRRFVAEQIELRHLLKEKAAVETRLAEIDKKIR